VVNDAARVSSRLHPSLRTLDRPFACAGSSRGAEKACFLCRISSKCRAAGARPPECEKPIIMFGAAWFPEISMICTMRKGGLGKQAPASPPIDHARD